MEERHEKKIKPEAGLEGNSNAEISQRDAWSGCRVIQLTSLHGCEEIF